MITYNDLKNYDYIFCDVFDTFVMRSVSPEYVKKIWSNYIVKYFSLSMSIQKLYSFRNKIEMELYSRSKQNGFDEEFKYEDLISEIFNAFKDNFKNIEFQQFYKVCVDTELEIEKNVQFLDGEVISVLKECKKHGKKIYCISDMYLSKNMIQEIFKYHGVLDLFDDIFISSEYLKNKKTGNLFSLVLSELSVPAEKCFMFGDNFYSDFEIPKKNGINSFCIDRSDRYSFYSSFDQMMTENKFDYKFKFLCKCNTDCFENIVFSLYMFIEGLYYDLMRNNKSEVIFLSREGEFLKKLFDLYVSKIYNKKIVSKYAIVSRKSTYLPSLGDIKNEDYSSLLSQYSYTSLNEFLKSLNLHENDISKILKSVIDLPSKELQKKYFLDDEKMKSLNDILNFDPDLKISYFQKSAVFNRMKNNEEYINIVNSRRLEQKHNFIKYFKQLTQFKDVSLVDIGWNGSIQNNISNILGKDYNINGYYLGLQKRDGKFEECKKGLVFSNVPSESHDYKLYSTNRTIYEILLGASHGSANEYVEKNGKVEVKLFSKQEERDIYDNHISKIQDRMLQIFSELCDLFSNGYYDNLAYSKKFNYIHFKTMFYPNKKQLEFFNNIYHYENFGVFEFTSFNTKKRVSLKFKIKEYLKLFLRFRTYFDDCFWPMLKLYNNHMFFGMFIYRNLKKIQFRKNDII